MRPLPPSPVYYASREDLQTTARWKAMITVGIRVQPGASRDEIVGWEDEVLRVRVRARAVEGKATRNLLEFLADSLGLRPYQVNLVRGERTRDKLVEIDLPSLEALNSRLDKK